MIGVCFSGSLPAYSCKLIQLLLSYICFMLCWRIKYDDDVSFCTVQFVRARMHPRTFRLKNRIPGSGNQISLFGGGVDHLSGLIPRERLDVGIGPRRIDMLLGLWGVRRSYE